MPSRPRLDPLPGQRAGRLWEEYQRATSVQFGQAMSTEGQGFATDAVLNTIPLPNSSGGTFTMWDLKADDFTTSNSGGAATTQTLLAAAGQLPFVLADPTLSGPQAVLYPPSAADGTFAGNPVQALLMTSADGQTNSLLCYGRAVALGIIAATDSNGNSTNKHIAVVVGSGLVGSMTSCPVPSSAPAPYVSLLAVVDLTGAYAQGTTVACDPKATTGSPNCPKAIGFLQLPTGGTDVKLHGNVALVATGTNILLINLEDPTHPTLAGQITGTFGNWLAVTDAGIVSVDGGNLSAVGPGSFTYNLNAGIANGDVLPQFSGLKYDLSSAQSLYDWFKTNLQSSDVNYQYGNWLTGTDGERLIPFIGVSDPNQPPDPTKPRQIRPVAPVDGRFTSMTAQFFAGSSYGPVHMTAFNLDDPTHGPDLMNVLKGNPIFIVFKDHANPAITLQHTQIGFELGATFTGANYSSQCPKPIGSAAPCGTEQWEDGWSDAFEPYNHGGEHYKDTPSDIIKLGRSYEPH